MKGETAFDLKASEEDGNLESSETLSHARARTHTRGACSRGGHTHGHAHGPAACCTRDVDCAHEEHEFEEEHDQEDLHDEQDGDDEEADTRTSDCYCDCGSGDLPDKCKILHKKINTGKYL